MLALIARATRRSRRGRNDDEGSRIGISQPSTYAPAADDNRNDGKAGAGGGLGSKKAGEGSNDKVDDGGLDFIVPTTIVTLPRKFQDATTGARGGDVGTPATEASSAAMLSPPQPPSLVATDSSSPSPPSQQPPKQQKTSTSLDLLSPLTAATVTNPGVGARVDVDDVDAMVGTQEQHRRSSSRSWRSRLNRTRDRSRSRREGGHTRRSRSSGSAGGGGRPSGTGSRRHGQVESGRRGYGYGADYDYGHDDATIASMNSVPAYVKCPGVERLTSKPTPSSSVSGSSSVASMPAAARSTRSVSARPARRSFSGRRGRNKKEFSSSRSPSPARSVHVGISQPEPLGSRVGGSVGGEGDFILPTTVVMSSFLKTQRQAVVPSSAGSSCCARSVSSCPAETSRDYGPSRSRGKNGSGGGRGAGDRLSSSSNARQGHISSRRKAAGAGADDGRRSHRRSSGKRSGKRSTSRHDKPPAVINLIEVFAADRRTKKGYHDRDDGRRGDDSDDDYDDDNGSFERVRHRTVADDMMSVSSALSGRSASSSLASLIEHHTATFRDQHGHPRGEADGRGKGKRPDGGRSARTTDNSPPGEDTASLPGRPTKSRHGVIDLSSSSSTRPSIPTPQPYLSRIFLLLLAPEDRKFELIQMKLHLKSSTIGDVLDLIPTNSTERALGRQAYRGLCRPRDGVEMLDRDDPAVGERGKFGQVEGWRIRDGEVLLAIPEGYSGLACSRMSHQILNDPGVVKMLQREDPFAPKVRVRYPSSASRTSSSSTRRKQRSSSSRSVQSTKSGPRRSKRSSHHKNRSASRRSANEQSFNHVGIRPRADEEDSMPVESEDEKMPPPIVAMGQGHK